MSKNTKKLYAIANKSKAAIQEMSDIAQTISNPEELTEFLQIAINEIYIHCSPKQINEYKALHGFSKVYDKLRERELKVKYRKPITKKTAEREIKKLLDQNFSYGEMAKQITARGYKISKSTVYRMAKGLKDEN